MQAPEPPPPPSPDAKPATAAEKRRRSRQKDEEGGASDDEDGVSRSGGGGVGGGSRSRSSSSSGGGCIGGGVRSHASLLPRAALEGQWLSPAEAAGRAAEVSFLLEVLEPYTAACDDHAIDVASLSESAGGGGGSVGSGGIGGIGGIGGASASLALKTLPADLHDLAETLAGAALKGRSDGAPAMTKSAFLSSKRFKGRLEAMKAQAAPFLEWFQ